MDALSEDHLQLVVDELFRIEFFDREQWKIWESDRRFVP